MLATRPVRLKRSVLVDYTIRIRQTNPMQVTGGVRLLTKQYQGFILDQFGVLHNGSQALPGAVDCVARLNSAGKRLYILSNSPQNEETTLDRLERLGFDRKHFQGAVTSGTLAIPELNSGTYGKKCVLFTWAEGDARAERFVRQTGVEPVARVSNAQFLLAHGTQAMWTPGDESGEVTCIPRMHECGDTTAVDGLLTEAVNRGLKMVCVNPDKVTVSPEGQHLFVPGILGARYTELGGDVVYFGKPYPEGFVKCLQLLGLPRESVAMVGDSLDHDIMGANSVGMSTVWITAGVHGQALGCDLQTKSTELELKRQSLETLCHNKGVVPTHVLPAFVFDE